MVSLINSFIFVQFSCSTEQSIDGQKSNTREKTFNNAADLPSEAERIATESEEETICPDYITYQTVGKPFMTTWCTPCHNSHLPEEERAGAYTYADFDDYEQVLSHSDRILARI